MKKFILIFISLFLFASCTSKEVNDSKPARLKEINGPVVMAQLDEEGNIIINKEDITTTATYITYELDGVKIGLLAVRDKEGIIQVVVNTCQSCGGSPYAYFVQVEEFIQCQNCGNLFKISNLDSLEDNGCNPIKIEDLRENEDFLIIGTSQFEGLKDKFKNWEGPKA